MANLHIEGSTEINESGITLEHLAKLQTIYETKRYYTSNGAPGWYKVLHIGTSGGYGNKSVLLHITPTIGVEGGSALIYITYYNNQTPSFIRLAGNLFSDRIILVRDSNNSVSLYMRTVNWYRPILVTILSGMYNMSTELWEGIFNGCGYIGEILPDGLQYGPTLLA